MWEPGKVGRIVPYLFVSLLFFVSTWSWADDSPSADVYLQKLLPGQIADKPIKTMGAAPTPRSGGAPQLDIHIPFGLNQYHVSSKAVPYIQALGEALTDKRLKGYVFEIQGHTCDLGNDEYNLVLSRKRAASVKRYLVTRYSLSPSRIRVAGYGKERPKTSNSSESGRRQNRRVTIVNTLEPFSATESRLHVTAHVKYVRGQDTTELQPGQTLTARDDYAISFISDKPCWIYVFQIGANGKIQQFFPNPTFHKKTNPVRAGNYYRLPRELDRFLRLDENKGHEEIIILASPTALNEPEKVCRRVLEEPAVLPRKPDTEAGKPVNTMGPKGTRTSSGNQGPAVNDGGAQGTNAPPIPPDLFTWRFPFRHQ